MSAYGHYQMMPLVCKQSKRTGAPTGCARAGTPAAGLHCSVCGRAGQAVRPLPDAVAGRRQRAAILDARQSCQPHRRAPAVRRRRLVRVGRAGEPRPHGRRERRCDPRLPDLPLGCAPARPRTRAGARCRVSAVAYAVSAFASSCSRAGGPLPDLLFRCVPCMHAGGCAPGAPSSHIYSCVIRGILWAPMERRPAWRAQLSSWSFLPCRGL